MKTELKSFVIFFMALIILISYADASQDIGILPIDPDSPNIIIIDPGQEPSIPIVTNFTGSVPEISINFTSPPKQEEIIFPEISLIRTNEPDENIRYAESEGLRGITQAGIIIINESDSEILHAKLQELKGIGKFDPLVIRIVPGSKSIVIPLNSEDIIKSINLNDKGNLVFEKNFSSGKTVSIERTGEKLILTSNDVSASTKEELKIKKSGIFIEVDGRDLEIILLPNDASNNVDSSMDSIDKIELKVEDGKAIYDISGMKDGSLFGIISISVNINAKVNAESGELYSLQKPWWGVLVF